MSNGGFRQIPAARLRPHIERAVEEHGSLEAFCHWGNLIPRVVWRTLNESEHVSFRVADQIVTAIDPVLWNGELSDLVDDKILGLPQAKLTSPRLSEEALMRVWDWHINRQMSLSEISRAHWKEWGYRSPETAVKSLSHRLRRRGLSCKRFSRPRTSIRQMPRRDTAKMTEAQVRAAHKLYESGWSLRELAEKLWEPFGYGCALTAYGCIREAFFRSGLTVRKRGSKRYLGLAHYRVIEREYRAGESMRDIAERHWAEWGFVGCRSCELAVAKALRQSGVPIRSRSEAVRLARAKRATSLEKAA